MRLEAKSIYGHQSKDYLKPKDPHFLREGHTTIPPKGLIFQLTEESDACSSNYQGEPVGSGWIVVEAQDYGGYHEQGIHKSKVEWH